jgi:hypothetical protein
MEVISRLASVVFSAVRFFRQSLNSFQQILAVSGPFNINSNNPPITEQYKISSIILALKRAPERCTMITEFDYNREHPGIVVVSYNWPGPPIV